VIDTKNPLGFDHFTGVGETRIIRGYAAHPFGAGIALRYRSRERCSLVERLVLIWNPE